MKPKKFPVELTQKEAELLLDLIGERALKDKVPAHQHSSLNRICAKIYHAKRPIYNRRAL